MTGDKTNPAPMSDERLEELRRAADNPQFYDEDVVECVKEIDRLRSLSARDGVIESDVRDILERLDYASKSKTFGSDDEASMVRVSHKIIRTLSSSLAAERGRADDFKKRAEQWFDTAQKLTAEAVAASDLRARLGVARAALERIAAHPGGNMLVLNTTGDGSPMIGAHTLAMDTLAALKDPS